MESKKELRFEIKQLTEKIKLLENKLKRYESVETFIHPITYPRDEKGKPFKYFKKKDILKDISKHCFIKIKKKRPVIEVNLGLNLDGNSVLGDIDIEKLAIKEGKYIDFFSATATIKDYEEENPENKGIIEFMEDEYYSKER